MNLFSKTNLAEEMPDNTSILKVEDKTLIYLDEVGQDTGEYANMTVSYGKVDIRTLSSEVDANDDGYQRELKAKRLNDILNDFHLSRLDPITISIRDGKRNNIDGQCRVTALNILYREGKLNSPMVFCRILNGATKEQEALLFATQDDGKTALRETQRTKGELSGKAPLTTSLEECLNTYGLTLHEIASHKTLKELWRTRNHDNFNRVCNIIAKSWGIKEVKKSVRAEIWKGLMCFYDCYSADIDDKRLITKLSQTTSDTILSDFQKYNVPKDWKHKYLKTFSTRYNVSKKVGLIDYK